MTRARLLHTFAHHELLSLELMALALLRYPQAPRAFRRGLVQVMKDEQRHLSAYLSRVESLGLEVGSEPVSDFFWRCVADSPTPHDFNARLALVFEQANLDFTRHYKPYMEQIGDQETADLLEMIYQDEIRHVRHGLHWFRQWRPSNEPEWESFCQLLQPPLSPGRARGTVFSVQGRRAAGFTEPFINSLRRWGGSVGRPPVLWWPNFNVEDQLSGRATSTKRGRLGAELNLSLSPVLGWLSTRGDVIIAPAPSTEFQDILQTFRGFNLEWTQDINKMKNRKLGGFNPWGWSPQAVTYFSPLKDQLIPSAVDLSSAPQHMEAHSKAWDLKLRQRVWERLTQGLEGGTSPTWLCPPISYACHSWDETKDALESLHQSYEWVVVKAVHGAAGRHMIRLQRGLIHQQQVGWLKRNAPLGFVLEPWCDRVTDLSFHARVEPQRVHYDGCVVSVIDSQGVYRGAWISSPGRVLSADIKRALSGDGEDVHRLRRVAEQTVSCVGEALRELGYIGVFGVDALLAEVQGELLIQPLVEVNPRWTMGRVALQLRSKLRPQLRPKLRSKRYARLELLQRPKSAEPEWAREMISADPPQHDSSGGWTDGLLPINDPWANPSILVYAHYVHSDS